MELERAVRPGDFYRHFKGGLYQVITVAIHSETKESMVVYQALYGGFYTYVRPFDMFVSKVDKEKYPEADQEYRFEKVTRGTADAFMKAKTEAENGRSAAETFTSAAPLKKDGSIDAPRDYEPNDDVDSALLAFLDAKGPEEKLEILYNIKDDLDERSLNSIETSLDIVGGEGTFDDRIEYIRRYLVTRSKYENSRLR